MTQNANDQVHLAEQEKSSDTDAPGVPARRLCRHLYGAQLLNRDDCQHMIAIAEAQTWEKAAVRKSEKTKGKTVRSDIRDAQRILFNDTSDPILDDIKLRPYIDKLFAHAGEVGQKHLRTGMTRIQSIQLIKYGPGGFYKWHRDAFNAYYRKISLFFYLNGTQEYGLEGGETLFQPNILSRLTGRSVVQEPRQGFAVTFHGRLRHKASAVKAGTKYAILAMFV